MRQICLTLVLFLLVPSQIAYAQHRLAVQGNDRLAIVDKTGRIEWEEETPDP
jgi:hypothetical protein